MNTLNTTVGALRVGDTLELPAVAAKVYRSTQPLVVEGVQSLGRLVIVDFTDGTATAPVPANAPVRVRRPA